MFNFCHLSNQKNVSPVKIFQPTVLQYDTIPIQNSEWKPPEKIEHTSMALYVGY